MTTTINDNIIIVELMIKLNVYCSSIFKIQILNDKLMVSVVTHRINDISVIYVTAHRCAGGLKKKLDLRSGSQRHRHFVELFNVSVQTPTRDQPFYTVIPTHRPK